MGGVAGDHPCVTLDDGLQALQAQSMKGSIGSRRLRQASVCVEFCRADESAVPKMGAGAGLEYLHPTRNDPNSSRRKQPLACENNKKKREKEEKNEKLLLMDPANRVWYLQVCTYGCGSELPFVSPGICLFFD